MTRRDEPPVGGAEVGRAVRWAFPLTSFHIDNLTDDKAREGSK